MNPTSSLKPSEPLYVFLDIDGVLVKYEKQFDQDALDNLNEILHGLQKTRNVQVVISSFWRHGAKDLEELQRMFMNYSFSKLIVGKTINTEEFPCEERIHFCNEKSHTIKDVKCRAAEIHLFIKNNNVKDYIIFDDNDEADDYHLSYNFENRFIKVNSWKLITVGIKNYVLSDLCGEMVLPSIKKEIADKQKVRASIALKLPENMPRVMHFYAYENKANRQKVNRNVVNIVAEVWGYFLKKNTLHPCNPQMRNKHTVDQELNNVQIESFMEIFSNKIYSKMPKNDAYYQHIMREDFNESLQAIGIPKDSCESFFNLFPFHFATNLDICLDGVEVDVRLSEYEPPVKNVGAFKFTSRK